MSDSLKEKLKAAEYVPTLYDLNKYFDDIPFVGDEETRLGLAMAVLRRKCIGIVSGSGTGKTAVVDAVASLLRPSQIYTMEAGSATAEAYSADDINACDLINLTELQKAANGEIVIELLKNLGEGKDYNRKVTQTDKSVEKQVIKKGKAVIYTKAIENKFETDDELDRRFPRFTTDMSKDQNERVVNVKADKRMDPFKKKILNDTQTQSLKLHMAESLRENANNYTFVNPMAGALAKHIPVTFAKSRSYADHFFDFIEGVAYFNRRNRLIHNVKIGNENKRILFVTPEDCWQLHQIYHRQFLQEVLNIPPNGIFIFDGFREAKKVGMTSQAANGLFNQKGTDTRTRLTLEQISNLLRKKGLVIKDTIIIKMLIDLMASGYVRQDVTQVGAKKIEEYYLSDELINFESNIDWASIIEDGKKNIKEHFPDVAGEYINRFCTNPEFIDPFEGKTIKVTMPTRRVDTRDDWLGETRINDRPAPRTN